MKITGKSRKAIELQVNFIVMLVLALIVFGIGLTIVFKIFRSATGMQEKLDQQTQDKIMQELMSSSSKIVIPFDSENIDKGKTHLFGIGIRNDIEGVTDFRIEVDCSGAYDSGDNAICISGTPPSCFSEFDKWAIAEEDLSIEKGDRAAATIFLTVPKNAKSGRYIFNVEVKYDESGTEKTYGTVQKLYVTVK